MGVLSKLTGAGADAVALAVTVFIGAMILVQFGNLSFITSSVNTSIQAAITVVTGIVDNWLQISITVIVGVALLMLVRTIRQGQ